MNRLRYQKIQSLMDEGEPVCVTFSNEKGSGSSLLYCDLVHRARFGESFVIEGQRCKPGDYILGISDVDPVDYYIDSGRYKDENIAKKAIYSLPRVKKDFRSLRIEPLHKSEGYFDIMLLYLLPERAMRILQAFAYHFGDCTIPGTIGAASICGDCTARPLLSGMGISYGCKGSRKHSGYRDEELPLGICFELSEKIEEGLKDIPATFD